MVATDNVNRDKTLLSQVEALTHIGQWRILLADMRLEWSSETYKCYGIEQGKQLTMEELFNSYHEEDRPKLEKVISDALETKSDFICENRVIHPNGNIRTLRAVGSVEVDEEDNPVSLFGIIQDVTELLKQELSLKIQHDLFQQGETLSETGHWHLNLATSELFWSDQVYHIHGLNPGPDVDLMQAINAYHPDDRELVSKYVNRASLYGEDFDFQLRLNRADGELRYVNSTCRVEKGDDGKPKTLFGVFQDVTERMINQRQLDLAKLEAEKANRTKSHFLAQMSHELRTPLNAIIGFSEAMALEAFGPVANPKHLEYIKDINRSGNFLRELVDDILDLSRIEAGQQEINRVFVHIDTLILECINLLSKEAELKDQIFIHTPSKDIDYIRADSKLLQQMIINILGNAVKYSDLSGEIKITAFKNKDDAAVVEICDNGPGVKAELLPVILLPFKQTHNSYIKATEGGVGLGLSIVNELMSLHGGRLELESDVGQGMKASLIFLVA